MVIRDRDRLPALTRRARRSVDEFVDDSDVKGRSRRLDVKGEVVLRVRRRLTVGGFVAVEIEFDEIGDDPFARRDGAGNLAFVITRTGTIRRFVLPAEHDGFRRGPIDERRRRPGAPEGRVRRFVPTTGANSDRNVRLVRRGNDRRRVPAELAQRTDGPDMRSGTARKNFVFDANVVEARFRTRKPGDLRRIRRFNSLRIV